MSRILLRGARQLVTLRGHSAPRRGNELRELAVIPDGALLIEDGIISEVGPTRRVENLAAARGAQELDASGHVVMPGFVDSHTHLVFGPPRLADYEMRLAGASYEDIAAAGGGILSSVRAVRATAIRSLINHTRPRLAQFVRHGTTTLEAKSGYGLDETAERKLLKAGAALDGKPLDIANTYLGAHVVPPEFAGDADGYVDWMCSYLMPKLRKRSLARFADVYCERGAFTCAQAKRYLEGARQLGFALKIHAEQFSNSGAARLAAELNAVSADHLDYATGDDARALAASGTMATLLPGAVFHLGLDRYPPARMLIEQGAAVALATDFNPGTSPTCSMPMIISLACAQMKMLPAEAIAAATINGAHALGRARWCGSLEQGKYADLLLLDVPDYREIPYHFGVNLVAMTMKRGRILYAAGRTLMENTCPEESSSAYRISRKAAMPRK